MNSKLYENAKNYFEGPDGMKNEVQMWFIAGGLLMQEISKRQGHLPFGGLKNNSGYEENAMLKPIEILDVCSGPGNFVNHLTFIFPKIKATCIDQNDNFINAGKKQYKNCKFIKDDAVEISLEKKFDFITASSAYHHIEDNKKVKFLKNIFNHLSSNGTIILCENFLTDYDTMSERPKSVDSYYGELKKYYRNGNATKESICAIKEVKRLEVAKECEHKVSFRIFESHLIKSGLKIDTDIIIWQPKSFIKDNAGSHVILLKKSKLVL